MSRNQERVLTDEQIKSIKQQMFAHIQVNAEFIADSIMNVYLSDNNNDEGEFVKWLFEMVEQAEDGELLSIDEVNNILNESNDIS
jgi:hypothetical protein